MSKLLEVTNQTLSKIKHTEFSRIPFVDETNGIFNFDCSSFINFLISKLDKEAYESILSKHQLQRLKAVDYFDFFSTMESFGSYQIKNSIKASHLRPGDLLIWRKVNVPKSGDTGHILIIKEIISLDGNNCRMTVYDCTKTPHDNDKRIENGGVGEGEMIFFVKDELLSGYRWSTQNKKNKLTDILAVRFIEPAK